jgi:RND family efflux transporter MFP subunit
VTAHYELITAKVTPLIAIMSLVGILAAVGCGREKLPPAVIQTVQAGLVQEIESNAPQRYSVVVLPYRQIDLAFKSPGLIEEMCRLRGADGRLRDVEDGDLVTEGTLLASVRPLDYQNGVAQAAAQLQEVRARLEDAEASFEEAGSDYRRATVLYHSASLTEPEFDRTRARYKSSQAQVDAARAAIQKARAETEGANLSLHDTKLFAPFTGFIVARNISRGSLVGNNTVSFSMIDTHLVKAEFVIPDTCLLNVHLGQLVTVELDALDGTVKGVVTTVARQADVQNRMFSVSVTITNANDAIRPGMIGSVSLSGVVRSARRLVVPLSSIVHAAGSIGAFGVVRIESRQGKNYARIQPIQIGASYGNAIEVTSGVSNLDRIVVLGSESLQDQQQIRVLQ